MAAAELQRQRSAFLAEAEDTDLDPTPRPEELPGGPIHAEFYGEAEMTGGRHWANATAAERDLIATAAAITARRANAQARRAGYPDMAAFLAATEDPPELRILSGKYRGRQSTGLSPAERDERLAEQMAEIEEEENWSGARALSAIDRSAPPPLLVGRLDPIGHTIVHGTGGAGKGTLATWWTTQLVREGHRVLILDYEAHPEEWARRYHGLAGLEGAENVLHVSPLAPDFRGPHGPIWERPDMIANLLEERAITYVIVDSIVTACGGADPMEPGTPARYAGALQAFGSPVLSLAHVTKADDLRYPFGSIFWHNLARVTWSLSKDGEQRILTNRKANNYENAGRSVLTITWRDGLPVDVLDRPYTAVLADRVDELLTGGALTVAAIVRRLNDDAEEEGQRVKADSVRAALRRGLKADPARFTVNGMGDTAEWCRP